MPLQRVFYVTFLTIEPFYTPYVYNDMDRQQDIDESEFHMWRAVFAFAFVDNSLSLEEQELLQSYMKKVPFSQKQLSVLNGDFKNPPDIVKMYKGITSEKHREHFCVLARALVWCEGDMDRQEEKILKRVSCLDDDDGADLLYRSREHAGDYYKHYAKAGMIGLMKAPTNFQMHV